MSMTVSHVAVRNRLMVGETITLHTRLCNSPAVGESALVPANLEVEIQVSLTDPASDNTAEWPRVLTITQATAPKEFVKEFVLKYPPSKKLNGTEPQSAGLTTHAGVVVIWEWVASSPLPINQALNFETQVFVAPNFGAALSTFLSQHPSLGNLDREREWRIHSEAKLRGLDESVITDYTAVSVHVMSRYAQNLPALYRGWDNDLLGRFLMMNDIQMGRATALLDHVAYYADPMLAPDTLLAWLMSWGGLMPHPDWPRDRLRGLRELISRLLYLRRMRGTTTALREHIKHYTGYEPKIDEPRMSGVQLSKETTLGPQLVLGATSEAHGFGVTAYVNWRTDEKKECATHRRIIDDIIEFQKPAHTHLRGKLEMECTPEKAPSC